MNRHIYTLSASPGLHICSDAAGDSGSGCCHQAVIAGISTVALMGRAMQAASYPVSSCKME